ncbi:hypothetical protein [Brachybacterium hainanense]|uniref:HTH marR-type domain-containing protein n=1 Tax=Brachybacterium hainanense TaxID=1541174 RepID=A0ABV6RC78_9MICO
MLLDAYAHAARAAGWLVISDSSSQGLLGHPGATFLRRTEHRVIGLVSRRDVRAGLAQTIADGDREIDLRTVDRAADAVAGYPFMIQLVSYYTVKNAAPTGPIDTTAVDAGVAAARRRLGRLVHAAALRPLSDVDRAYLLAMAQDDGPLRTGEIAARMGISAKHAGQYRRRLIRDGIIEPAGHGLVRFAIPYPRRRGRSMARRADRRPARQTNTTFLIATNGAVTDRCRAPWDRADAAPARFGDVSSRRPPGRIGVQCSNVGPRRHDPRHG